jgi:hypothetical protein
VISVATACRPERTRGLQVDEHLDFTRLLHRQIRLTPFENPPGDRKLWSPRIDIDFDFSLLPQA